MRNLILTTLRSISAAALLLASARAQLTEPGSLLVYPEFDNRPGHTTVVTVTNTESFGASVRAHFIFVDAVSCNEFDRSEILTPNDTFSAITTSFVSGVPRGFGYVFAQSTGGQAISHNHLVGMTSHLDGIAAMSYSLAAVTFRSPRAQGANTDLDFDGVRDLDGLEYNACFEEVLVPRFLGQRGTFQEELILIPLSGGSAFTTTARFLVYNDNENVFSASYPVRCWARVPLTSISSVFTQTFLASTNDDPGESLAGRETGWFVLDGGTATSGTATIQDPALLGVLISPEAGGGPILPYGRGTQTNAGLLPHGVFGD
ncbi:MAG: hypothetical protein ACKVWV_11820 [Planctomycetota bacterium]